MIDVTSTNLHIRLLAKENLTMFLSGGHLQVIFENNAKMDTVLAVNFIKSGEAEIAAAVDIGLADFNKNAGFKTADFNENAVTKTTEFDDNAAQAIAKAKLWADEAAISALSMANRNLSNLTADGEAKFSAKQNVITDLSAIRSGASAGATALQRGDNISELNNDSGFITSSYHDSTKQDILVSGTNIKTVNNQSVLGSGNINTPHRNIGEIIYSTIPLTDAGLHLLDGALIQGNGIYADFVTYIAGLVNTYSNIFTTESDWQSSVSSYGVCGKFVYDSTNNTIRLPKITGFVEGTTDLTTLGDLIQAGLPNIIGYGESHNGSLTNMSGAFKTTSTSSSVAANTGSGFTKAFKFDASLSNPIYGNSSTVQPQSIKLLYYIVIATTTKTQIEADIDEIANDLNGKADTSLANVTTSGKHIALDWGFPSTRAVQLTIGANNTSYTAPANGWFTLTANEAKLVRFDGLPLKVTLRDSTSLSAGFIPVRKGETIILNYDTLVASYEWTGFWFVYAQGEE